MASANTKKLVLVSRIVLFVLLGVWLMVGCGTPNPPNDAQADSTQTDVVVTDIRASETSPEASLLESGTEASVDAGMMDVSTDVFPDQNEAGLPTSCLDRPEELPRVPIDRLPCELIPPSF